ncbi:MAG: ArnT family glycosyltransferase, partial [Cetobacterium somerae]
ENSEKVYSYRFEDAKNISNEINKNSIENIPLEDLSKMNEGELLLVKKKYKKDISDKNLEEIYSNKEYVILIKK